MEKGFTMVKNKVIQSGKKITDAEFRLYCTLLSFDFQKGLVFPSRETLSKYMGASLAKIDRIKSSLEDKGAFRKKRRGQGISNIYILNKDFLIEADDLRLSHLDSSQMSGRKEDEVNKTLNNNYLTKSKASTETDREVDSQPLSKNQPKKKPQTEVIFRKNLKRVKKSLDSWLDKYSDSQLDEATISRDTDVAIKGILYYIRKYKLYCRIEHPLYKLPQLRDCMEGFLNGMWYAEHCSINLPLEKVIEKTVDRWFETTSTDTNGLRLSVFVGQGSSVFYRALNSVMADYGLEWKEDTDVDS